MENKAHALAAGIFVLLLTAVLIIMAVWLTREVGVQNEYALSTRDSVTGLQTQAAVRFRGVAVGKVTEIGFDPQIKGNVLLRISIAEEAPITRSTFATLGFQGVTGLAFVQLDDSGESREPLKSSGEQLARIPVRPGLMSKLTDQGVSLVLQLEETSRRMNQLLDPAHQKAMLNTVEQLGQAAASVKQLASYADELARTQLGPNRVDIPQLAQEAGAALRSVQDIAASVSGSADEVKKLAGEFRRSAERLNQPGGTLDRLAEGAESLAASGQTLNTRTLPRVNRMADETARAARQLGRAASTFEEQPQSLILGKGAPPPGPGEPGFAAPAAAR